MSTAGCFGFGVVAVVGRGADRVVGFGLLGGVEGSVGQAISVDLGVLGIGS